MGYAGYGNSSDQTPDKPSQGRKPGEADKSKNRTVRPDESMPPSAGPHAEPGLVNPDATPGAGALPTPGARDGTDSTSG
jgi:hypothetical protein